LNKKALQNLFNLRKNNFLLNKALKAEFVEEIQLSYVENFGIGGRGSFYEETGALRDMVQSHILEALALAMTEIDPEIGFDKFKDKKAEFINSLKLTSKPIRGQYKGYLQEENVDPDSETETYIALRFQSELNMWKDVPISIRTGKKLADKFFDIHFKLKNPLDPNLSDQKFNEVSFRISPNSGVNIALLYEDEDLDGNREIKEFDLTHCYRDPEISDPYANVIAGVIREDSRFFVSLPEIKESWKLIDHIIEQYERTDLHIYDPGSYGPEEAEDLITGADWKWLDNDITDFCKI
jgi:glucose-6-phosphate 1-dehydrogenase